MNFAGKRIVTYARFSSDNQRDASIEDQQRKITDHIAKNGGDPSSTRHFCDKAVSAASLQRDGLEAMMSVVRAQQADVIVTENVDRLSRNAADTLMLHRELMFLGVQLVSVSNPIDLSSDYGQLILSIEGWKNEQYLKDLSYKTRRGQEGRVLKGLSAGGLPLGFRTASETDADGKEVGRRIEIDEARAAIVRRIYSLYLEGNSLAAIAKLFNAEGVEPARRGKYKNKGWVEGSVRQILRNEAYVGVWTWGKKRWVKLPGTNKRRYREAAADQVVRREYPDRRIIDQEVWEAVQARIEAVAATYTRSADGAPKGRAVPGKAASYPLSSILHCSCCGSRMIVYGGTKTTTAYYRCGNNKKKGICQNALSLREDIARRAILGALRRRYSSPAALQELRSRIAHWLGERTRTTNTDLAEMRGRLGRTEARIRNVSMAIADGDMSATLRQLLKDLETQKATEAGMITATLAKAESPVRLPAPDELVAGALGLERAFEADPTAARDRLSRVFEGGRLLLEPQPERIYIARSRVFPLAIAEFGGGGSVGRHTGSSGRRITPAQPSEETRDPARAGPAFRRFGPSVGPLRAASLR